MAMDGLEGPPEGGMSIDDMVLTPGGSGDENMSLERASAKYVCKDDRFRLQKKSYDNQYAQLYFCRLQRMQSGLTKQIQSEWPGTRLCKILDLPENQEVAVIGTVYKEMKLKPSILQEYNKDRGIETLTGHTTFVSDDDSLVLEDESDRGIETLTGHTTFVSNDDSLVLEDESDRGIETLTGHTTFVSDDDSLVLEDESARMAVKGNAMAAGPLVTGVVAAVRGVSAANGDFQVKDVMYAGLQPQQPLPQASEDKYVALVSGLSMGDEGGETASVALLVDYLAGLLGGPKEHEQVAKIVRTVIAGGLLRSVEPILQATSMAKQRQQAAALAPIKEMDMALTQLAGAMDVDVMAGSTDPANHALPQQPLHSCLLPGAVSFPTLHRVTNPHEFEVDGVCFLGTSGQNIEDIDRYSTDEDRLRMLEHVLEWGHLAPTAPDTLTAYSFSDKDPFVIESAPHVLFAGNQPSFETKLVEGRCGQKVRLICIPKFSSSGMLVLVNLRTLNVQPITFDARLDTAS